MKKKILVVDDEHPIREMIRSFLSEKGYDALTAGSAEKAMEILKHNSILVIFLDLNLPGMGGVEFCKKMRRENHVGLIYAITGFVDLYSLIVCRNAGFDDFFAKPFLLDVILKATEEAFEKLKRWRIETYDLD